MQKYALQQACSFIDSWLTYRFNQETIPGLAVAIAHKGTIVYEKYLGYADIATKTPLSAGHAFRIASQSKTFTATALMQLQEQNALRIDDPVVQYLPWLKQHTDKRWQSVTIRQLLSHSAGVIRDGNNADYWQLDRPFPDADALQTETLAAPLILEPNTKLKYSNVGYSLLGLVIAQVSGSSYETYIAEHIVNPLQLQQTGTDYATSVTTATGYTRAEIGVPRLPIDHIPTNAMAAATGFYATATDLCRYYSAQMLGTNLLLTDESKKEMQRVQWSVDGSLAGMRGYGLGFNTDMLDDNVRVFGHGGGFPGYITKTYVLPDDEIVITVLTNCVDGPATPVTRGICGIVRHFNKHTHNKKTDATLSKLTGRYMNLHSYVDFVIHDDTLVAIDAGTWQPFSSDMNVLRRTDDHTFTLVNTGNFDALDESVIFNVDELGLVLSVTYGGNTLFHESDWIAKQKQRQLVALTQGD